MNQRATQAELLLHAAGKLDRRSVREWRKARAFQQLGDAASTLVDFRLHPKADMHAIQRLKVGLGG
jgi:hypothetical protein